MTAALTVTLIGALVLIGGLAWLLQSAWPLIVGGFVIGLFGAFRVDAVEARNQ